MVESYKSLGPTTMTLITVLLFVPLLADIGIPMISLTLP